MTRALRSAHFAGSWYPGDPAALRAMLRKATPAWEQKQRAKAVVVPHAGYRYSLAIAAETYARVEVPRTAVVLCPNHSSYLDPAFVQLTVRRRLTFVMTNDFYSLPGARWFFKLVGAIPVGRGRMSRKGLRRAMALVKRGHVAFSFGAQVPVAGTKSFDYRLLGFFLWEYADGGLWW